MHTYKDDDDDDDDDGQQVVEESTGLQQEQLSCSDNDVTIGDEEQPSVPGPDSSAEDESAESDSGSDKMELSQQNQLHKPHRDPILCDQASGIEKKATIVDTATVRKHVKRTLMKKHKPQRRQPPPPQGGNRKVRKQHSKRKQIPDYFEGF